MFRFLKSIQLKAGDREIHISKLSPHSSRYHQPMTSDWNHRFRNPCRHGMLKMICMHGMYSSLQHVMTHDFDSGYIHFCMQNDSHCMQDWSGNHFSYNITCSSAHNAGIAGIFRRCPENKSYRHWIFHIKYLYIIFHAYTFVTKNWILDSLLWLINDKLCEWNCSTQCRCTLSWPHLDSTHMIRNEDSD